MRNAKRWGLALAALVVAGWSVAVAQTSTGAPGIGASGPQLAQADALIYRMESTSTGIRRQLEQARGQRDVVKTLCLNDKLNQIDVAIRTARERRTSLDAALRRGDTDLANHETTILQSLGTRSTQLSGEANQCIGQELNLVGRTAVTTSIDPNLPRTDPTAVPDNAGTISLPPGCSSCIK